MNDLTFLYQLAVIFGVAVVVVLILARIGLPSIAGMLMAGVLMGPNGLGLISNLHQVEVLAEVGVVLLLFTIGLEVSLERLRRIWRLVAIGGGVQVTLTALATAGLAVALGRAFNQGLFFGF
ncbi:MAG: cation:proton antiporter, partial [SAR324 cluster bacterium]|nr:cation:proton antiporter [SAR324 cluster bacterium]